MPDRLPPATIELLAFAATVADSYEHLDAIGFEIAEEWCIRMPSVTVDGAEVWIYPDGSWCRREVA